MLRLLNFPIADLALVFQSDYGMPTRKPTFFATWRMKTFDHQLQQGRAPCSEHLIQALSGRNDDGIFKTAIAKEYLGPLCSVIAKSTGDFGRACDIECGIDECSPSNVTIDVSFDTLTSPFLVPLTDDLVDFGDDFVDTGVLPLLQLPNLACSIVGLDVI